MKRRISLVLAAALATAGFVILGPAQPASAWVVCAGQGTATVNPGLLYPVNVTTPSKNPGSAADVLIGEANVAHGFSFTQGTVVCAHPKTAPPGIDTSKTVNAVGVVKGYCGLSSGNGRLTNGDLFSWISVGGVLILTGHIVGIVTAAPDVGEDCAHMTLPGGATRFIVAGAIVLLNCTASLQTLVPGTPDTEFLRALLTTQHLNAVFHVLVDLGVHVYFNHLCVGPPVL